MKILHVLDHSIPIQSGYSFRSRSILLAQAAMGIQTCHLTGIRQSEAVEQGNVFDTLYFHRTDSAPLQKIPILKYVGMVWAMKIELQKIIASESPDIIHAHSPVLNALAGFWASKGKIPIVYEVRAFWEDAAVNHGTTNELGLRYRFIRWLETMVLKRASAVVTICEGLREAIVGRGIASDKVFVVANAVNITDFVFDRPKNLKLVENLKLDDSLVVGFIGSFYAYEGLDTLIRAIPEIKRHIPHVKILLVGGDEQEMVLRELVESVGVLDTVIFTGKVPHSEVAEYYSIFDLLVYPRKRMRLTELVTPLKPLEAFAQGKLVALSDVGGQKEIAGELFKEIGFISGNEKSLASKVISLLKNADGTNDVLLKKARRYVETDRTWSKVVDKYNHVYALAKTN